MSTTTKKERNTYHLWELTDPANSKEVYELAAMAAELHVENYTGTLSSHSEWDEDAQSIVYAIHRKLWEMPRATDNTHPPYTHRIVNSTSVRAAAIEAFPMWRTLWDDKQFSKMTTYAYRILAGNQLLMRYGAGARLSRFLIRAWPEGYAPGWYGSSDAYLSIRDRVDIERQVKKAEELAGPVTQFYSLKSIPPPEANAQSVMAYLEKLKALIGNLERENSELRDEITTLKGGDWQAVVDAINNEEKE